MGEIAQVVVVGAGSAGAVIARRLVDAGATVTLVEAGGPDADPAIHDPRRVIELRGSGVDWAHEALAHPAVAGRRLPYPRGRVLGGSSAINGMIYIRGHRLDYDHWAYLGNHGWGWDDVLPLFRRSEDFDGGASALHGAGGPWHVLSHYEPDPLHAAVIEAAVEAGIPRTDDHNGERMEGVCQTHFNIRDGRRESTAGAFLAPIAGTPGLTILTGTRARRLLLDGDRCVGVEVQRDGGVEELRAGEDVVLCAGAFESPRILTLSGIAGSGELARLGIEVRVDLPGVGANLQDHLLVPVILETSRPPGDVSPGLTPMQSQLFWHSRPGLPVPDLQPLALSVPLYDGEGLTGPEQAFTLGAGLVRPASRGTVRLRSADPADALDIDPRNLTCDADVDALVACVELCREIGRAAPLADGWGAREIHPSPTAGLRDFVRRAALSYAHPVGTCRMGTGDDAVVDPELRVRGVEGLRVADASIMPVIPSGNTAAPTVMIGERASELIAASLGLQLALGEEVAA
jgi:choline dehydrogenase